MKKTFFTFIALFFLASAYGTIRRVNNNPGVVLNSAGPAFVYSSFSDAHLAASSTVVDTIYLEPSDISYGGININKKIVLIGAGYFLDKNPITPFDKRNTKVSGISIVGTNTPTSTNPTGTVLYGLTVQSDNGQYGNIILGTSVTTFGITSDITVIGCLFNTITRSTYGGGNNLIKRCFIIGDINNLASNSVISNSILLGSFTGGSTNNLVKNSIIFGGITPNSAVTFNNIIFQGPTATLSFPNESNVFNNVCVGCTSTPGFNNFFTTASNTIFQVAEPRILDDLWDERFKLATSSPAKTKGVNGVDCGVFAGNEPYVLSGLPPFPMVTAFSQGAPSGGNIPITISIKRN